MRDYNQYLCATEWNPGLDNGHRTLRQVLDTLPGLEQDEVHWLVRLFENPKSPLSFPGQISLERHDALHVLLGRGLSNQDEAFVIGFTMGAASNSRLWHDAVFLFVAQYLYPKDYRFNNNHRQAFRLGLGQGMHQIVKDVHLIAIEEMMDETVNDIRDKVGIDIHSLHACYAKEKILIPGTPESIRLDHDWRGIDPSSITQNCIGPFNKISG